MPTSEDTLPPAVLGPTSTRGTSWSETARGLFHVHARRKGTLCICGALSHPQSATVLTVTLWTLQCHKP